MKLAIFSLLLFLLNCSSELTVNQGEADMSDDQASDSVTADTKAREDLGADAAQDSSTNDTSSEDAGADVESKDLKQIYPSRIVTMNL